MERTRGGTGITREFGGAPTWFIIVAILIIGGVAAYALTRPDEPPSTSPAYTYSPEPRPSSAATTSASSTPKPSETLAQYETLAYVGDTVGTVEIAVEQGESLTLAGAFAGIYGADAVNLSVAGTGYVAGNASGEDYVTRADEVVAAAPDLVFVTGGRADAEFAAEDVEAAALELFARLAADLPDATVVVFTPTWDDDEPTAGYTAARDAIIGAAQASAVTLIDIGEPLVGQPDLVSEDGVTPNDAGLEAIATAMLEGLEGAGLAPEGL